MKGTLSVALCTYNGASFVREQLDSISAQTRRPDELVVRDDGSTDSTVDALVEFAATAPFPVHILESGTNLGYARNFERVVTACSGSVIALSDQDDVWMPNKLERLERSLTSEESAVLSFSDASLVDERLQPLGLTLWETLGFGPTLQSRTHQGGRQSPLFANTFVTGAASAFRSSLLSIALPFPFPFWHDAWLATLAAAVGRVVPISEPLFLYRQHGNNAIGAPATGSRTLRQRIGGLERGSESANKIGVIANHSLALYSGARTRLAQLGRLDPDIGDVLNQRVQHAQFRAELPPMPRRIWSSVHELAGGNYSRYSNGMRGFVRDLLR